MSLFKSLTTGLIGAVFGAAAMHMASEYQDDRAKDAAFDAVARNFVTENIIAEIPALESQAERLAATGKQFLQENNAILCVAGDKNVCYLDSEAEQDMLWTVLDDAQTLCDENPVTLKDACETLKARIENLFEESAPTEDEHEPEHEAPIERLPFYQINQPTPKLII